MSNIPPRAVNAANRILTRLPETKWSPEQRDVAAAIIANEMGHDRAHDACRKLLSVLESSDYGGQFIPKSAILDASKLAEHALRR